MRRQYILYNPEAGKGAGKENAEILEIICSDTVCYDITKIESFADFFRMLDDSDEVILCGGDGTLHRFANDTKDLVISNPIYYMPSGSHQDFIRDLDLPEDAEPNFRINDYLRGLPSVLIHGQKHLFLNSVGFGLDGFCCAEGDRLQKKYRRNDRKKSANDTMIAIKGLLFRFKPRNAIITVDGVSHHFKKVWLAPAMHGRYCGGGMMAAPKQDRLDTDKRLSIMVMHGVGRLRALCLLPTLFKGKHVRFKKHVSVLTGHEITAEFDRPTPLQIDGEVILDVRAYQAKSPMCTINARNAANGGIYAGGR